MRLRRLVALQVSQKDLLRFVFERHLKLVLALLVLFRTDLRLQGLERAEGVVRIDRQDPARIDGSSESIHVIGTLIVEQSGGRAGRGNIARLATARIENHAPVRDVDPRLAQVRKPHGVVVGAEFARMLLVVRRHLHLVGDIFDQFVRIHVAVVVLVRGAFQALDHVIAEHTVSAAELRAFERNLLGTAGQQTEQVAFDIAELLDVRAHHGVVDGADSSGLADIHEQKHAPHFAELVLKERLELGHRQGGALQILRIGVVGQDERVPAARHFHRAMAGDQNHNRVVLARAAF